MKPVGVTRRLPLFLGGLLLLALRAAPADLSESDKLAIPEEERAGNATVREHIRSFKGRGQVTEPGVKSFSPPEALKQFTASQGLEMRLTASEPEVRQPVSISFDARGRMWVVQYLQYPFPAGLKILKYD